MLRIPSQAQCGWPSLGGAASLCLTRAIAPRKGFHESEECEWRKTKGLKATPELPAEMSQAEQLVSAAEKRAHDAKVRLRAARKAFKLAKRAAKKARKARKELQARLDKAAKAKAKGLAKPKASASPKGKPAPTRKRSPKKPTPAARPRKSSVAASLVAANARPPAPSVEPAAAPGA